MPGTSLQSLKRAQSVLVHVLKLYRNSLQELKATLLERGLIKGQRFWCANRLWESQEVDCTSLAEHDSYCCQTRWLIHGLVNPCPQRCSSRSVFSLSLFESVSWDCARKPPRHNCPRWTLNFQKSKRSEIGTRRHSSSWLLLVSVYFGYRCPSYVQYFFFAQLQPSSTFVLLGCEKLSSNTRSGLSRLPTCVVVTLQGLESS